MSRYIMLIGLALVILAPGVITFMVRHHSQGSGALDRQQSLVTESLCTKKLDGELLLVMDQRTVRLPPNVTVPCYNQKQSIAEVVAQQPLDVAMLATAMDFHLAGSLDAFAPVDSSLITPFEQAVSVAALRTGAQVQDYACDLEICIASLSIHDDSQVARLRHWLVQTDEKTALNRASYWLGETAGRDASVVNMLIMQW